MLLSKKFSDPKKTADGSTRASVDLKQLKTLWFNTGTQCNLECQNCYIESSPTNDRLSFIQWTDVQPYLDEIRDQKKTTEEIAFTGGEPFLNPHMLEIIEGTLQYGFRCLILTNAHRLINRYSDQLEEFHQQYPGKLIFRVSLDHYSEKIHEQERGPKTFQSTLNSMKKMAKRGFHLAIAGRHLIDEKTTTAQRGYQQLLREAGVDIDYTDPSQFVVFPEMSPDKDVPEITTACWGLLKKSPDQMMCASSRMIVKRKGQERAKVLACTLLAYDQQFELGETLADSKKTVQLNHPFCAQFCVLGGASCS